MFLTPPIEDYLTKNVRKKFVTTKFWQIFKLGHPIVMGGEKKPGSNKSFLYIITWEHTIDALE